MYIKNYFYFINFIKISFPEDPLQNSFTRFSETKKEFLETEWNGSKYGHSYLLFENMYISALKIYLDIILNLFFRYSQKIRQFFFF